MYRLFFRISKRAGETFLFYYEVVTSSTKEKITFKVLGFEKSIYSSHLSCNVYES